MYDNPYRSYRSTDGKSEPKATGKFNVAFGEVPRLSSFELKYDDDTSYVVGTTGHIAPGRGNHSAEERDLTKVAAEACRLLRDPNFIQSTLEYFGDRSRSISPHDIRMFADNLEHRRGERGGSYVTTGKLMG